MSAGERLFVDSNVLLHSLDPITPHNVNVLNPKRDPKTVAGKESWYPYYAGFSHRFAENLLASLKLPQGCKIMDPWNGSGTTSLSAIAAGYSVFGFDLNPVMVIAAKAHMLNPLSKESLLPLTTDIVAKAFCCAPPLSPAVDPLCTWLTRRSASLIRRVDAAIHHLLINAASYRPLSETPLSDVSDLTAFFYVALFRTGRRLLRSFFASNPTWVKRPRSQVTRLRPSLDSILSTFKAEVCTMISTLHEEPAILQNGNAHLTTASSDSLPLDDESIDFVLTSPPYCTRIDYTVATSIELALLGYDSSNGLNELRRKMIGTSVVPSSAPDAEVFWGPTCNRFLDQVATHTSKASHSYYLKNHLQYFSSVFRSVAEISRVLKRPGSCSLVVQDSHYKEIHNDLPQIFIEMADAVGLRFVHRVDFKHARIMAGINPGTRHYRLRPSATESVLFLSRE